VQDVPPPMAKGGSLAAVSCGSPLTCMAVGYYTDRTGGQAALAQAWNGRTWSTGRAVSPSGSSATSLTAVSCPSRSFCMAVGTWASSTSAGQTTYPLAEVWQRGRWSVRAMPNPVTSIGTVLTGVACTSAVACIAVGSFANPTETTVTLGETWNGRGWSIQRTANVPNPTSTVWGALNAIWCESAKACTAVGYYQNSLTQLTLAESWNGKTWSVERTPNKPAEQANALIGLSCRSARQCLAVGNYLTSSGTGEPLAEAWNGRTWSVEPAPAPAGAQGSYLYGAACPSAGVCLAVGYAVLANGSQALAEQWNGHAWSIKKAPPPAGSVQSELSGIWCQSARACVAVGDDTSAVATRTLAEAWSGSAWSPKLTPDPAMPEASGLNGVSCSALGHCVAVGYYTDASFTGPLTELWNGKAWSIVPAPSPAGMQAVNLDDVSCASADNCVAVGSSFNGTYNVTLAETWNGKRWSIAPTPNVSGAQGSILTAVSCPTAGRCVAVGSYLIGSLDEMLAETWNGHAWSISNIPNPSGSDVNGLSGVSCPAVNTCTAVGSSAGSAVAEAWNGSAWSIQAIPSPAGGTQTQLQEVSCPSAASCTAVGNYFDGTANVPLAEGWNGKTWSVQSVPTAAAPFYTTLQSVSCPASGDCTAVGYSASIGVTATLAAAWNGHRWAIQPIPNASGAEQSYLNGVSCPQPGDCSAVGEFSTSSVSVSLPLAARYQR
jgi:hypothetical protein